MFFNSVSDNESEHENEEEEWEAQQIRKGVTGAQVKTQFIKIKKYTYIYIHIKVMLHTLNFSICRLQQHNRILCCNNNTQWV